MRTSYHTQQKTAVLAFLRENEHGQYTIDELLCELGEDAPGKSSAYRILKKLCDEGLVRRLIRDGSAGAVYQLAGEKCCSEHLHIKCLDCGTLMHLDRGAQEELTRATGFVIDDARSMLYGRCARCARRAR